MSDLIEMLPCPNNEMYQKSSNTEETISYIEQEILTLQTTKHIIGKTIKNVMTVKNVSFDEAKKLLVEYIERLEQ